MREGFHLSKLVDHVLEKQGRHESRERIRTLAVSRAFLFKLMLDDPRLVAFALEHSYVGSLEGLLRDRFALSEGEIRSIGRVPALSLKLPEQKLEELPALISRLTSRLHPSIAEKPEPRSGVRRHWFRGDHAKGADLLDGLLLPWPVHVSLEEVQAYCGYHCSRIDFIVGRSW
jgi:hypothetical protein